MLTKRGILFNKEPRMGRKVFAAIGFADAAFGVSVDFF
jgi:hypothetical protein